MKKCKSVKETFRLIRRAFKEVLKTGDYDYKSDDFVSVHCGICRALNTLYANNFISKFVLLLAKEYVLNYTNQNSKTYPYLGDYCTSEGTKARIKALDYLIKLPPQTKKDTLIVTS